jgi:small-conductance mechanosensitive channel
MDRIAAVRHVNGVLLILAMTWLAMAAVSGLAKGVIARHPTNVADNLQARRIETQARILSRTAMTLILIAGAAIALMTFPGARHVGASLLASAGVIGLVGGLAARPVFSNLIAGLQLAIAQPIRIGDVLKVKDDWGSVEEITGTYVVLRVWDDRRQIIPLNWFIENPFENWTRTTSDLLGTVVLHLNYATPIEPLRAHAHRIVEAAPEWDKRMCKVQVEETTEATVSVRILVSAFHPQQLWDLRCRVREDMLAWLAREYPQYIPPMRPMNPPPAA